MSTHLGIRKFFAEKFVVGEKFAKFSAEKSSCRNESFSESFWKVCDDCNSPLSLSRTGTNLFQFRIISRDGSENLEASKFKSVEKSSVREKSEIQNVVAEEISAS